MLEPIGCPLVDAWTLLPRIPVGAQQHTHDDDGGGDGGGGDGSGGNLTVVATTAVVTEAVATGVFEI